MNEAYVRCLKRFSDEIHGTARKAMDDVTEMRPMKRKERRERIAIAAMQALLSTDAYCRTDKDDMAVWAVKQADALMAELDKEEQR